MFFDMSKVLSFFLVSLIASAGTMADDGPYAFRSSVPPAEYKMDVHVYPDEHRMEVSGTVTIAASTTVREYVEIQLSELMPKFEAEVLEPADLAGPARTENKETKDSQTIWKVIFNQSLPAGKSLTLKFRSAGGQKIGFVFYLGAEGSFASGLNTVWYPHVLTDGANLRVRGRIHYFVPKGYVVASDGTLLSSSEEQANGSFLFGADRPGYFTFATARFVVSSHRGKVPTSLFLLHRRDNGEDLTRRLSTIIDFLTTQLGPFPYAGLSIVETPHEQSQQAGFSGGGAGEMMLVDTELLDSEFLLPFYAHELGHFWWGGIVQGSHYLDETMAQYGSLQAVEALEGEAAAERYRRSGYPGYSTLQCARGYFMLSAAGFDHSIADLPDDLVSHELADSKGMLAVDMLSRIAGRQAFTSALQSLIRQKAYGLVDWKDILDAAQKSSIRDLHEFYSEWFQGEGAPTFSLKWKQAGETVSGYVLQDSPYYSASLEVGLHGPDGRIVSNALFVQGPRTSFQYQSAFKVQDVVLDPHYRVLRWTPEFREEALALAPYWGATVKRWSGDLAAAQKDYESALRQVPRSDTFGLGFALEYGLARVFILKGELGDARSHLEEAVHRPTNVKDLLPQAYLELARIAKKQNDIAALRKAVEGVVAADAAAGGHTGTVGPAQLLLEATTKR
jgi:tetratricopeptide (TPR) repeat protein